MAVQNKVVVVTGASQGIGKAIVEAFAEQGAKAVLLARRVEVLEELEDQLLAKGADVVAIPTDIRDAQAIQEARQQIEQLLGPVDILINNAAVAVLKPFAQSDQADWQAMIDVNLYGMFQITQAFLPQMIERRTGMVINLSAAIARSGFPNLAIYSATKAAVIAFSEALAKEVRRYGISVNSICPHGVDTELYHALFGQAHADQLLTPQYVAQEILQVAAGESGLRSGQTLDLPRP
jgi:NADP-dependent 3-hydroxy acid dehydrogenase YdfG